MGRPAELSVNMRRIRPLLVFVLAFTVSFAFLMAVICRNGIRLLPLSITTDVWIAGVERDGCFYANPPGVWSAQDDSIVVRVLDTEWVLQSLRGSAGGAVVKSKVSYTFVSRKNAGVETQSPPLRLSPECGDWIEIDPRFLSKFKENPKLPFEYSITELQKAWPIVWREVIVCATLSFILAIGGVVVWNRWESSMASWRREWRSS